MFLCEVSTEWYERYQHLLEVSDEFGGLTLDEPVRTKKTSPPLVVNYSVLSS